MNQTDKRSYNTGRIDNISYSVAAKKSKTELVKELEKKRVRDAEMVVCKFKNDENPGRSLVFTYRRYKDQKPESYKFICGETYQIPRGVRNHVRGLAIPEYEYLRGNDGVMGGMAHNRNQMQGQPIMQIKKKKYRFQFLDLDYLEESEDYGTSNVVEVTYANTGMPA